METTHEVAGTRYTRWTVLDPKLKGTDILCRCDCGTEKYERRHSLRTGESKSCGCLRAELLTGGVWDKSLVPDYHDTEVFLGSRHGRLTVTGEPIPGKNRKIPVECDCGTRKEVVISHLLNKKILSCGCYRSEGARQLHRSAK